MKCFVASAFGETDVDEVFNRSIRPVLKRLSVQALRVDRLEHNEDIDDKIFELLEQADLAVADLTYARPSVYYEAGYAAGRGKPVIYVARKDHFKARDSDPKGNYRIHFDLQMKNIIPWSRATDAFSIRLEKRLRHVLKPLLQNRDKIQKRQDERSSFAQLAHENQINLLAAKARSFLEMAGFIIQEDNQLYRYKPFGPYALKFEGSRVSKRLKKEVQVICTASAAKKDFDIIQLRSYGSTVESHYFVVSLKFVPPSRVSQGLSSSASMRNKTFHRTKESKIGNNGVDVFVHVIDAVRSESEFVDAFRLILDRYRLQKRARQKKLA